MAGAVSSVLPLKWKEPRLRDWNDDNLTLFSRNTGLKWKEPRLRDWNWTTPSALWRSSILLLEMKRTSITRLKRDMYRNCTRYRSGRAWNEKNLDYEIETQEIYTNGYEHLAWNEKNLDYEIETGEGEWIRRKVLFYLKWKEPRLRDWNDIDLWLYLNAGFTLEMKRTSITRLKRSIPW